MLGSNPGKFLIFSSHSTGRASSVAGAGAGAGSRESGEWRVSNHFYYWAAGSEILRNIEIFPPVLTTVTTDPSTED